MLPIVIGLLLAAAMSRARVRGLALFRTILFLPQVIALVVVAVMWRMIYEPDGGLLNRAWRVGLGGLAQDWLGDFSLALPSVGLIGTWVMYGLAMVLFTAGVQKIPQSLYDAARMDGAGPVREFFAVTLPGLRGEIAVALTLTTIEALRNFDLVYITTGGGPGDRPRCRPSRSTTARSRAARSAAPRRSASASRRDLRARVRASTGSRSGAAR